MNPNTFKIEMVEGCNRMCEYCGIQTMWKNRKDRKLRFMQVSLAKEIAESISTWGGGECSKKRIEFAMHGEPLLHPEHLTIIQTFRKVLPNAQMTITTNGVRLPRLGSSHINTMFDLGLNYLLVSLYSDAERAEIMGVLESSKYPVRSFYDKESSFPYHYHGPKEGYIIVLGDIGVVAGKSVTRPMTNHGGNSDPEKLKKYGVTPLLRPLGKTCSKPFREMAIKQNGAVVLCCFDWCSECILGMFPTEGDLNTIWNNDLFQAVRSQLQKRTRNFAPCRKCNFNGGFRLGLLPKVTERSSHEAMHAILLGRDKYKHFRNPNASATSGKEDQNIRSFL